jgi:hypothetical protein
MRRRVPRQARPAAAVLLAGGLVLAALATGCSRQPATAGASVASCTQFGIAAVRHHVTVTALPAACRGLTRAQVNFAVGTALREAAGGGGGRLHQRARIGAASRYLEHLVSTVPRQPSRPPPPTPATKQASPLTLGLVALCTWLITVALGLWMMARWIIRRGPPSASPDPAALPHGRAGRLRRPPALNAAHLVLAGTSLLIWIVYLATRLTGVAWAACALLPLVAGLGMMLVFLPPSASSSDGPAAAAPPAGTAGDRARDDSPRRPRPPVFAVAAHIAFATATILFAVLTAIGIG